jgi:HAD superfamily hydrolase (TIGR01450 family)
MTGPPTAERDVLRRLRGVRGYVFDMDGTLVLGNARTEEMTPLPGALEITGWLSRRGLPYVVLTNGTVRTPRQYAGRLRDLGFALDDDGVVTPASSAVDVLTSRRQRRVMVLGVGGLREPLAEAGIEVLPPAGRPDVDAVLVGWYRDFTFDALEAACHAVWAGARVYSASQSVFFATVDGRTIGTSRAITAMIRSVTGCRVEVIGKPSSHALRVAARRLGAHPSEVAVVGDDPDLEVPMAHSGKAFSVAVETGIGGPDAFSHLPASRRPDLSLPGVAELLGLLEAAEA